MITRTITEMTIDEYVREMGLEPNNKLDWWVGQEMQRIWCKLTGAPRPPIALKRKTNASGSHDKAHYNPETWRATIQGLIRQCETERSRQPLLFEAAYEAAQHNGEKGVAVDTSQW